MPREVGAALLASAEGYTPRATQLIEAARERLGTIQEIAGALADDLPAPKTGPSRTPPPAQAQAGERRGRGRRRGTAAAGERRRASSRRPEARRGRSRRRRRKPRAGAERAAAEPRRGRSRRAPHRPSSRAARACNATRREPRLRKRCLARHPATLERVIVLLGIGFLAGVVTAISPCVLPVLPILLAGGATGRKPLRIVAGLVASFVVFTLFAAWLLDKLGLPADFLRNLAIALLFLVAATLLVPRLALWIERPFARLTRASARGGGGFLLGASLGLVFVPCAGPVLAAVTVVAANNDVGWRASLLTLAYALGAAVPMAADRVRRQAGSRAGCARTPSSCGSRRASLIALVALGVRLQRRHALPDRAAGLHRGVPEARRAERHRAARAREARAARRSGSSSRSRRRRAARPPACPTTASRPR